MNTARLLGTIATVAAGLFAGAALYVTVVAHPGRRAAPPLIALAEFRVSFPRAARLQAGLAVTALSTGVLAALVSGQWSWAVGGATVGAVVPFTLLVMREATNRELLEGELTAGDASRLLARWGRLHAVRTVLGLAGFLLLLAAARRI